MNVDDIISRIRRGEDSVTQFKRQAVGVATIASFASKELPYRGLGYRYARQRRSGSSYRPEEGRQMGDKW